MTGEQLSKYQCDGQMNIDDLIKQKINIKTVTERVCENGLKTVTVNTDTERITSIPGDKPIGSRVTVSHNMWGYTAEAIGE